MSHFNKNKCLIGHCQNKRKRPLPNIQRVHDLLEYDGETGLFKWRFSKGRSIAGNLAGCISKSTGYIEIGIDKASFKAHRLAWFMTYGTWPDTVDHKNGVKTDNRISNLREATQSENKRNSGAHRDNASGYKGVSYAKKEKKWVAWIMVRGKSIRLGGFMTPEDAANAYADAASKLHGEFARTS